MMSERSTVGSRLQALRKERDLTQRDLASRAGLSANAISLIERDEISPSVATLQRLATALCVKISYFFEENKEQTNVLHVKTHQRPSIVGEGVSIEALGRRLRGQEMEPFLISLASQAKSGRQPVIHPGHELVYCLRGSIEYEVDGNIYILEEGDILFFEAEMPHLWQNPTPETAEFLLILHAPDESAEPVRRHFPAYPSLSHIG